MMVSDEYHNGLDYYRLYIEDFNYIKYAAFNIREGAGRKWRGSECFHQYLANIGL